MLFDENDSRDMMRWIVDVLLDITGGKMDLMSAGFLDGLLFYLVVSTGIVIASIVHVNLFTIPRPRSNYGGLFNLVVFFVATASAYAAPFIFSSSLMVNTVTSGGLFYAFNRLLNQARCPIFVHLGRLIFERLGFSFFLSLA